MCYLFAKWKQWYHSCDNILALLEWDHFFAHYHITFQHLYHNQHQPFMGLLRQTCKKVDIHNLYSSTANLQILHSTIYRVTVWFLLPVHVWALCGYSITQHISRNNTVRYPPYVWYISNPDRFHALVLHREPKEPCYSSFLAVYFKLRSSQSISSACSWGIACYSQTGT